MCCFGMIELKKYDFLFFLLYIYVNAYICILEYVSAKHVQ